MNSDTQQIAKYLLEPGKNGDQIRRDFLSAHVSTMIARQIKWMRKFKEPSWSQSELGKRAGMKQSVISRLESTAYDKVSLPTLIDLATALGVGLQVRFVSLGKLLDDRGNMSPAQLYETPYAHDIRLKELAGQHLTPSPMDKNDPNESPEDIIFTGSTSDIPIGGQTHPFPVITEMSPATC